MKKQFFLVALALLLVLVFFIGFFVFNTPSKQKIRYQKNGYTPFEQTTLWLNKDDAFTTDALNHKIALVYFGYTFCPDVCPTSLKLLSAALNDLGQQAQHFQPVFISVDPKRDKPEIAGQYAKLFGADWMGLSASIDDTKKLTDFFHVYAETINHDEPWYLVNHSSFFIAILPNQDYTYILHEQDTTPLSKRLLKLLQ